MLNISSIICWLVASGKRNGLSSHLSLDHWLKSFLGISSKTQENLWEYHCFKSVPRYPTRKNWQKLLGKNNDFSCYFESVKSFLLIGIGGETVNHASFSYFFILFFCLSFCTETISIVSMGLDRFSH